VGNQVVLGGRAVVDGNGVVQAGHDSKAEADHRKQGQQAHYNDQGTAPLIPVIVSHDNSLRLQMAHPLGQ
jgi:hypothetical protein